MLDNRNATILAVDDNDALRYSLSRTLQGGGYNVVEARNGAEALRLAENCPDLITLDVQLPDTNGFEVGRLLKANPRTKNIPILHISATFVEPEYRVRGLEVADGYLAEPISREELLATVAALLRLKQAEREAQMQATQAEQARRDLEKAHDELELKVRERTRELDERNREIRDLTGRLLKLQDEERRRLARELHDSTGQMLAAMKMNLCQLSDQASGRDTESLVKETIALNDELCGHLRTMSYLLHPPLLDELGLASALAWYAEGFTQRGKIVVDLEVSPDFTRLPEDLELTVFRVVQECLTNIHRHSGSSSAKIRLTQTPEEVRVEVIDAGRGIPADRMRDGKIVPGIGIMGIHERMRQLGGNLEVNSSDKGTTVTATLPLQQRAKF
ncbi:MAG TPA: response regulator [Candidatus Sulfotelmatobacter sp.]|nr:response regulator [Candidatus Sulfotelmatobacter sp.]